MKFVIEMNEKEMEAIKKAGKDIKGSFKKIKDSFQVRIVRENTRKENKNRRKR